MDVGGLEIILLLNVFVLGVVLTMTVSHFMRNIHKVNHPNRTPAPPILSPENRRRLTERSERQFQQTLDRSTARLEKELLQTTLRLHKNLDNISDELLSAEMDRYKKSLDNLEEDAVSLMGKADEAIAAHEREVRQKITDRQTELESQLSELHKSFATEMQNRQSELQEMVTTAQQAHTARQAKLEAELEAHQVKLAQALTDREQSLAERQAAIESELIERQKRYNEKQSALNEQLERDMALKRQVIAAQIDERASDVIMSFLSEALGENIDLGSQADSLVAMLEQHKQELIDGVSREA